MAMFLVRQPNGLLCRFSTILDCPTNWNLTDEDFVKLCVKLDVENGIDELVSIVGAHKYLESFIFEDPQTIFEIMKFHNMSKKEFENFLIETGYKEVVVCH